MKKWFKKENVFFVGTLGKAALISAAALTASEANAQQTAKKITVQANQTLVELFQIRNGTNMSSTYGAGRYDQGWSAGMWSTIPYLESTGQTYSTTSGANISPLPHTPEQIGNGTFDQANPQPYTTSRWTNLQGRMWDNNNAPLPKPLTIKEYDRDLDAQQDSDTMIDVLKSRWILPHTYDDGTPLPVGLWVIMLSREGNLQPWWWSHIGKRIWFRRNGSVRAAQPVDRLGDPFDILPDSTLGVNDVSVNKNKGVAYPNPTPDEIHLNDGDSKQNESFDYVIYDVTGRQVWAGKAREDQAISLWKNNTGTYIINTRDADGDTNSHKVIKK